MDNTFAADYVFSFRANAELVAQLAKYAHERMESGEQEEALVALARIKNDYSHWLDLRMSLEEAMKALSTVAKSPEVSDV